MELNPQIRIVSQPGRIMIFSVAQMHSTVPNISGKTRFSIDFRIVHFDDAATKRGAPNIDSACTGTAIRDFLCGTDLVRIPEEIALLYDEEIPTGEVIFNPAVLNSFSAKS